MTDRERHAYWREHQQDDGIDEIRIVVRERYKTSGLSGDEWRFHRVVQFMCKGDVLYERAFNGRMAQVASWVPRLIVEAMESGDLGPKLNAIRRHSDRCMQPGCPEPAVSVYELKAEFGPQGQTLHPDEQPATRNSLRRRFCRRHLTRGDCGREDSDDNYRVLSGPGPRDADWSGANVTESASMMVSADSVEQIPEAIDAALAKHRRAN